MENLTKDRKTSKFLFDLPQKHSPSFPRKVKNPLCLVTWLDLTDKEIGIYDPVGMDFLLQLWEDSMGTNYRLNLATFSGPTPESHRTSNITSDRLLQFTEWGRNKKLTCKYSFSLFGILLRGNIRLFGNCRWCDPFEPRLKRWFICRWLSHPLFGCRWKVFA